MHRQVFSVLILFPALCVCASLAPHIGPGNASDYGPAGRLRVRFHQVCGTPEWKEVFQEIKARQQDHVV